CEKAEILDLANNPLPLWDQGVWDGDEKWKKILTPIQTQCQNSDAFVIVTPEWHGQVPAGLKNLFLLLSKNEAGHKPAMIVAVSSADGGAYPVAELRMSSYKNNRICYIPDHVIVRNVEKVLNDNAADNNASADEYFRGRILWTLGVLKEYAVAMKQVRASGNVISKAYGNGM
ncbi:MAG TPA: NAD(P)H-dependent oxidoreductase, partial [Gammaproteobacteria bacterium]|nr:NAD(P)H-dependent oxidoreductase [Gammaproteobacteria bacterium]